MKIIKDFRNISQEFRLKTIDETRNYLLEEIEQNEMMSRKYKKFCTNLNYIEHFLFLASAITWCISLSPFASFLGIPIWIMSSSIELNICAIAAGTRNYEPIIKKKKKKHNETVLLEKTKIIAWKS